MNEVENLKKLAEQLLEDLPEEDHAAFLEELREYSPRIGDMQKALDQFQTALNKAEEDIAFLDTPKRSGPMLEMLHGLQQLERNLSALTEFIWGYPLHRIRHY